MKGVVFTEFLDLVDRTFGEDTADRILGTCPLQSGGAYTTVGTYEAGELHALVGALSAETNVSPEELQGIYGRALFGRFVELFPEMFGPGNDAFAFLASIDEEIHAEVRKLYPDAELPELSTERVDDDTLLLHYRSRRNLPFFCEGLIRGAVDHFAVTASIEHSSDGEGPGALHTFRVVKEPGCP